MKTLVEYLKDQEIFSFYVETNKDIYILGTILKNLGIDKFEISTHHNHKHKKHLMIPSILLKQRYREPLISLYIIYKINRLPLKLTIGIDPGASNTGLAIITNDILAYVENIRNHNKVSYILEEILNNIQIRGMIIKIGYTSSTLIFSHKMKNMIENIFLKKKFYNYKIIFVKENKVKEHIIKPYINKIRKNPHIFSALQIALWQIWKDHNE